MGKASTKPRPELTLDKLSLDRHTIVVALVLALKTVVETVQRSLNHGYLRYTVETIAASCRDGNVRAMVEMTRLMCVAFMKEIRHASIATIYALRRFATEIRRANVYEATKELLQSFKVEKEVDRSFDGFFRVLGESTALCTLFVSAGKLLLHYYLLYLITCACVIVIGLTAYRKYHYVQYQYKFIQKRLKDNAFERLPLEQIEPQQCVSLDNEEKGSVVLRRPNYIARDNGGDGNLSRSGSFSKRPLSVTSMEGYLSMTTSPDIDAVQKQLFEQLKEYKSAEGEEVPAR